jgi:hypothetical protein
MKRCDEQVCVKLPGPLRVWLEGKAVARDRSVSWMIRRLLADLAAQDTAGMPSQREAA